MADAIDNLIQDLNQSNAVDEFPGYPGYKMGDLVPNMAGLRIGDVFYGLDAYGREVPYNWRTGNFEFQPTSFSPKDMTYNDSLQYMATQVARLMNVPAYYISADMNNSLTYSNVQDERRQFVALSLQPYVSAVENRFSMDDLTSQTQFIAFDMDSGFLRANPLERLNVIEKMLQLNLISVEEAREMEELSPNGNN